ncbi:hypothetical protein LSTR_LSTR010495 [Laodelphax striatellus]|uniref:DNA polymerase n=1 Tax=Laodelphax striatellus TaxID=195883 RepID=A0A482X673_LAOST|nr:hypothetical protein LSTR_LSTR010495 [Laodelphax striatellus]
MILELHVQTRGDLLPDPENDPIRAVFYHIVNDVPEQSDMPTTLTGMIAVGDPLVPEDQSVSVTGVSDEMALLVALVELIRKWDPEMFIGYEIEKLSWGYLIERAYTLGMNLNMELSRVRGAEGGGGASRYEDEQGGDGDIRLAGRIVLNVWRLLRSEVALQSYTFENIMYHVLRRRIPLFSFRALSAWWEHRTQLYRWMTVDHYLVRVKGVAEILDHLDLIGRTSELARLFGIQFYEVLSRGSQFRVESMMLRMAKPENYVAVSPTTRQRAHMRAPESLPLIMEPESRFYSDPVIVLDFQSLYPSIIIAYNYCFSTCLGRVENLAKSELFDFGCTHLRVPFSTVKKLEENLNFSPCGVAFVNSSVRRGVLPRMLQEILETRLMVKRSMKKNKNNKALHKVLHNRQLGLKLIANVTYGYTSANFSGRMPCIEIGDSVVSKGRETLERAIALVQNTQRWSARVVYGDTDSLFVLVPGRTRADAFRIGAEIADAVTADNPRPVKLKLEKVYQPCILQTKKRYVGHMWESADQEMPTYDAKGIETVRRDGCPAVAKVILIIISITFSTSLCPHGANLYAMYLIHLYSLTDYSFFFHSDRGWMKKDRRSEPRTGERVPYVIVSGPPGLPLIRLVRSPHELLADPALKVNADYYISRVIIPPLNRCLLLVGANVHNCCAVCHDQSCTSGVCDRCRERPQTVAVSLAAQLHGWERRRHLVLRVCQSCCGRSNNIDCRSLDCPVLYARADAERQLAHEPVFRKLQQEYFNCDF